MTSGDLAAGQEGPNPVRIQVIHLEVIEDIAVVRGNLPTANCHATLGWLVSHGPGDLVRTVDRLFNQAVAAQPDEVVPVSDLPFDVTHPQRTLECWRHRLDRIGVEGGVVGHDVSNLPGQDTLHGLDDHVVVTPAEPRHQGQPPLFRELHGLHDGPDARRVHGHWLLAEDMLAGIDAGPQVGGTESRWRCQQYNIDAAVDNRLKCVQAHELIRLWHSNLALALVPALDLLKTTVNALPVNVCDCREDCQIVSLQRLCSGTGTPATTANQPNLDFLPCCVQEGRGTRRGSALQERTARPTGWLLIVVDWHRTRIVADVWPACRKEHWLDRRPAVVP